MGRRWDAVYEVGPPTEVSWYQREPLASLDLIDALGVTAHAAVLDVGGGASTLVDTLLARGFVDVSVLDVSAVALGHARHRLGASSHRVHWLHEDLLTWSPARRFDLWHDRAVFHFLVEQTDGDRYLQVLASAIRPGGHVIVATFAADGPEQCSGFPVARYDPDDLARVFGGGYQLLDARREEHTTPSGTTQPFTWVALGRVTEGGPG